MPSGERANRRDGEEQEGNKLPTLKWDFTRDILMTNDHDKTLGKNSGVISVSRYPCSDEGF